MRGTALVLSTCLFAAAPLAGQGPAAPSVKDAAAVEEPAAKAPADELAPVKAAYNEAFASARTRLLADFDAREKAIQKRAALAVDQRIEVVKALRAEREAFEADGTLPKSSEMAVALALYQRNERSARIKCTAAFKKAADAAAKSGDLDAAEALLADLKQFLTPEPAAATAAAAAEGGTPGETTLGEAKPAEGKPGEGKPGEAKPVAGKPGAKGRQSDVVSLFNGKDLAGWRVVGDARQWSVENGVIACKGEGTSWLLTEKSYADFELQFEYRMLSEGANSGVAWRSLVGRRRDDIDTSEIDLLDEYSAEKAQNRRFTAKQRTGAVYNIIPAAPALTNPLGEWNTFYVALAGRKLLTRQNGRDLAAATLDDFIVNGDDDDGNLSRAAGPLGFQGYRGKIEFRNVYVRELKR